MVEDQLDTALSFGCVAAGVWAIAGPKAGGMVLIAVGVLTFASALSRISDELENGRRLRK
jgi:hypothetical protein